MCSPLPHYDAADLGTATGTRFVRPAVYVVKLLEAAALSETIDIVRDGRTFVLDRCGEDFNQRRMQALGACR